MRKLVSDREQTVYAFRCQDGFERICTFAFLGEIFLRFLFNLPDWRSFWGCASNIADTILAIVTTIIQIPVIRGSSVYPWLTAFQLARFYRVILVVPRMKSLLAKLVSSVAGLVNMIVFLLLMNFLAAIIVSATGYLRRSAS